MAKPVDSVQEAKVTSLSIDYISHRQLSNACSFFVRGEGDNRQGEARLENPFPSWLPEQWVSQWVRLVPWVLRSIWSPQCYTRPGVLPAIGRY